MPYSIYLNFHLLCSMTKLKEHSREICYCGSNIHIEQSWLQCKKKISRNLSHYPKIPCDNLPLPSKVTTMELTIKAYEWKIFEFTRLLIRPKSGWGGWLLNDSCSLVEILKLSRGCVVQWLFYSGKIPMQMIPIKIKIAIYCPQGSGTLRQQL